MTERVYRELLDRAGQSLSRGESVLLDASCRSTANAVRLPMFISQDRSVSDSRSRVDSGSAGPEYGGLVPHPYATPRADYGGGDGSSSRRLGVSRRIRYLDER